VVFHKNHQSTAVTAPQNTGAANPMVKSVSMQNKEVPIFVYPTFIKQIPLYFCNRWS